MKVEDLKIGDTVGIPMEEGKTIPPLQQNSLLRKQEPTLVGAEPPEQVYFPATYLGQHPQYDRPVFLVHFIPQPMLLDNSILERSYPWHELGIVLKYDPDEAPRIQIAGAMPPRGH